VSGVAVVVTGIAFLDAGATEIGIIGIAIGLVMAAASGLDSDASL
jgi:hypothetical protein